MIEKVSPTVIIIEPPEQLIIETRQSGYAYVTFWFRNGDLHGFGNFMPYSINEYFNFADIYAKLSTATRNLGTYTVIAEGTERDEIPMPDPLAFWVTRPSMCYVLFLAKIKLDG